MLNLFLVLLLSSFSADALDGKAEEDEVDKITEAKGRIVRFFAYIKKGIVNKFCAWRQQRTTGTKNNGLAFSDSQMEEMSLMKGIKQTIIWFIIKLENAPSFAGILVTECH